MTRTIFILVPSPCPTGPIKGAYALANALAIKRRVVLVFLKDGPGVNAPLHARVEVVSLAMTSGGWIGRLKAYRKLLGDAGGRAHVGSVSMCLSADCINLFCRKEAVTCASVRGNLLQNYHIDYGWSGIPLARSHLFSLRAFDHVVAMTHSMAEQLHSLAGLRPYVIGNFVDEAFLNSHRRVGVRSPGPVRFVFVGSLTRRKQPELVVAAMAQFRDRDARLDIIGDGPQRTSLKRLIESLGLEDRVFLHGQLINPYSIVAGADIFVLPSRSEGVSRAALEALYLGVPCVLRDVDGNAELFDSPGAGALFTEDSGLANAMLKVAASVCESTAKTSLLPPAFQQCVAAYQYLALLEHTV